MQQGAAELIQWLQDLFQQGLAHAASQPKEYWQEISAKLVDVQLGGLARRIRRIHHKMQYQEDWVEDVLYELSEIYLATKSLLRFDEMEAGIQNEVLTVSGVTIKKALLEAEDGIEDVWHVLGQMHGEEENFRFRRSWLYGAACKRFILILEFAFGGRDFTYALNLHASWKAEAVFYPAGYPLRAHLKSAERTKTDGYEIEGYANWDAMYTVRASALAANPWLTTFPACVADVVPVHENGKFFLVDTQKKCVALHAQNKNSWKIISISGGNPIQVFGESHHHYFVPMAVIVDGRIVSIVSHGE